MTPEPDSWEKLANEIRMWVASPWEYASRREALLAEMIRGVILAWADRVEALGKRSEADIETIRQGLCDGLVLVRGWHADGTDWSDYDTQVEKKLQAAHDAIWRWKEAHPPKTREGNE